MLVSVGFGKVIMQKRKQAILNDAYYNFDNKVQAKDYEQKSYAINRRKSIWWACQRCKDDEKIRDFVFRLRAQFRERLLKDFPGDAVISTMLEDGEDPNHFFDFIGDFVDAQHNLALKEMALFFCEQLKTELNLDLHPSFFKAERSHSKKPPPRTIRVPKRKE